MTRDSHTDRELWVRAKARSGESAAAKPGDAEDLLLLSAYLDGRLAEREWEAVEARLAAEPELLDTLLSARQALDEGPAPAPEAAVARAQAIVGAPAKAERRSGGFLGGTFGRWLQPLGWAAVCALALIVSGAGFEIGREGYDAVVEYQTLMTETVAFEMPDPASDLIL